MSRVPYTIRAFEAHDADACFRIRTDAFVKLFQAEIGPAGAAAGINAYLPTDYVHLAQTSPAFVADEAGEVIGFVALRFVDDSTVGIHFLYVRLDHTGRGIGRALVERLEDCVRKEYPQIQRMVLNTAVPRYNQAFYERLGFVNSGDSVIHYPDGPVTAIRLEKMLR
jgi:ribosomal protein S18 acetylase RimI-like enzyme